MQGFGLLLLLLSVELIGEGFAQNYFAL